MLIGRGVIPFPFNLRGNMKYISAWAIAAAVNLFAALIIFIALLAEWKANAGAVTLLGEALLIFGNLSVYAACAYAVLVAHRSKENTRDEPVL